jgi:hypothetical protein
LGVVQASRDPSRCLTGSRGIHQLQAFIAICVAANGHSKGSSGQEKGPVPAGLLRS